MVRRPGALPRAAGWEVVSGGWSEGFGMLTSWLAFEADRTANGATHGPLMGACLTKDARAVLKGAPMVAGESASEIDDARRVERHPASSRKMAHWQDTLEKVSHSGSEQMAFQEDIDTLVRDHKAHARAMLSTF